MTPPAVVAYLLVGAFVGLLSIVFVFEDRCAKDVLPAIGFFAGLLWPLTVAVGALCSVTLGAVALGRSFVALARAVWGLRPVCAPRSPEIPRATARPSRVP